LHEDLLIINKMSYSYHQQKKSGFYAVLRSVCCAMFLFCICGRVGAQYQIPFINYTMKNGLVQNQVQDICQDHKGYIWIATVGGVSRYDGKHFKNFTVSDGLPVNTVTELLVDSRNRIWMATIGGGLTVYDGKSFRTYTTGDGLLSNNFNTEGFNKMLMEDSQGNIWCRTGDEGISVIGNSGVITYNKNNGLVAEQVKCFKEDSRGRILCATEMGLFVIDRGKINRYIFENAGFNVFSNIVINRKNEIWVFGDQSAQFVDDKLVVYNRLSNINAAGLDYRDRLWISSETYGLYIFEDGNLTRIRGFDEQILKIIEDNQHNMWLMTQINGVYRLTGDKTEHYSKQYGLVDNTTNCVFEDEEGNIWIGTNNGISMYGKVIFETLTVDSGLPDNQVLSVAADLSGNVWCGPLNRGLVRIHGQQLAFFESQIKEIFSATNSMLGITPVGKDLILGSSGAGMGRFSNGRFLFDTQRNEREFVNKILIINDREYWAASSMGLIHVCGENKNYYTVADGLPDDYIVNLARDDRGRIWCIGSLGLSVFDGKQFVNYTVENGLPNNSCTDIAVDKYGAVWVGTENGLCKITEIDGNPDFKIYTTANGLFSNSINLVHADFSDRLWVGYLGGLNTIDLKTGSISNYNDADGFHAMDIYYGAAATDSQGNVWFGTVEGLVKYNPQADQIRTTPPRTYITGVSLSNRSNISAYADSVSIQTGLPVNLSLPYHLNDIRIEWIGVHYTIPSKNKYRFMLEGYDKIWCEASVETSRTYRLSPGHYTFKVIACNNDGVWTTDPVEYSFTIRPPWWANPFAYIVYALLLAVLIYLYIRWRERKLMEEKHNLEEKVYERTIEIELQKQNILEVNKLLNEHKEELIVQRDMAAMQRDQIAEQRREIMDSIHYAQRIQNAILPNQTLMDEIIPDYFVFFRPRNIVSGDFYWATKRGNKTVVVAADCTGHGVPGAFMSMLGISFLNEIVLKREIETASKILNELRLNIKFILSQTGVIGEQRDGMDMALCIIDYDTMKLQYAGANNPLCLVRDGVMIEYKADKMPVGIYVSGKERDFTNHLIPLKNGDMLYIFSDGYHDQFGGKDNSKFKSKPFKQLLTTLSELPLARQKELLIETHDQWKGNGNQLDDILVIGIRI